MPAKDIFTPYALRDKPNTQQCLVILKVTSPLFYAQVARCTSILERIKVALLKQDTNSATFHISHPDLFTKLQEAPGVFNTFEMWPSWKAAMTEKHAALLDDTPLAPTSLLKHLRWVPIFLLRRLPSPSHHHALSDLDACAVHLPGTDAPKVRAYRKAVLKVLLSDYLAFGIPAVIDAVLWITKVWLCWLCVQSFDRLVGLCNGHAQLTVTEVGNVVMGCLGVHLWWGLGEVL